MSTLSLARLMAWLSPVFPTGGFAYSVGLEQAVADGRVHDQQTLQEWLRTILTSGSMWNDAVLLAAAYRTNGSKLPSLSALARALAPTAERHRETVDQGAAFLHAAEPWAICDAPREAPLPVAIGAISARAKIPLLEALTASLQTQISNQLQAAIRLSVTGQTGAAQLLARLETTVLVVAERAEQSTLDDLGGSAFIADITSGQHETLEPRIFLS
ncbi:MAG: urease accessory protein UreF [Pseudomonadota bacterium]